MIDVSEFFFFFCFFHWNPPPGSDSNELTVYADITDIATEDVSVLIYLLRTQSFRLHQFIIGIWCLFSRMKYPCFTHVFQGFSFPLSVMCAHLNFQGNSSSTMPCSVYETIDNKGTPFTPGVRATVLWISLSDSCRWDWKSPKIRWSS